MGDTKLSRSQERRKRDLRNNIMLTIALIVVVAVIVLIVINRDYVLQLFNHSDSSATQNQLVTESEKESVGYNSGADVVLDLSTMKATVLFDNPANNDCYQKYTVTLCESEAVLYQSDYLKPGDSITQIDMTEQLEVGEYDIFIDVVSYDMTNQNQLNGVKYSKTMYVK